MLDYIVCEPAFVESQEIVFVANKWVSIACKYFFVMLENVESRST